MTYCGIDDNFDTRYCQSGYYCCDSANNLCCLSTVQWYSWWWVWVVFFVVILALSLGSYCCRKRYVRQRAVVVRGTQPVQCGVTSVTTSSGMPMYPAHGQPGAPPTAYPGASPYPAGASPYPEASPYPGAYPYPGYSAPMTEAGPTSPPYPTQAGLPQNNIPGYASVPPPYESVAKQ